MPNRKVIRKPHTVDSTESSNNEVVVEIDGADTFLTNVIAQNETDTTQWDFVIHPRERTRQEGGLTLGQHLSQIDAAKDVIWEGRQFLPRGWRLSIVASGGIDDGDKLTIRVGFESVN